MSQPRVPDRTERRIRAFGVVPAAILAVLAMPAAVQAGVPDFTFNVYLGGSCVSGIGPVSASIDLTLRNSNDVVKSKKTTSSNASGNYADCFSETIESGDRIRAVRGSAARTFTAPVLTAITNGSTDVVTGHGPPNSSVSVDVFDCEAFDVCPWAATRVRPTNGNGIYTTDLTSALDLRGHDFIYVHWTSAQGDQVYRTAYVSWVTVEPDRREFHGYGNPAELVTIRLKAAGGALRGSGQAVVHPSYANFDGEFRKDDLAPVQVRPGNKVTTSFGTTFTVPTTSLTGKASDDSVTGKCTPNRAFSIYAYDPAYARPTPYSYAAGTTNASGAFSADMSNPGYPGFNLMHGDGIFVRCMTASGDEISLRGDVP